MPSIVPQVTPHRNGRVRTLARQLWRCVNTRAPPPSSEPAGQGVQVYAGTAQLAGEEPPESFFAPPEALPGPV
jgi:hypothetical protein